MVRKIKVLLVVCFCLVIFHSKKINASTSNFKVKYTLNDELVYEKAFNDHDVLVNYVVGYTDLIINILDSDSRFSESIWGLGKAKITFEGTGSFNLIVSNPASKIEKNVSLSSVIFEIEDNKIYLYINSYEVINTDNELTVKIVNNQKLAISGKDTLVVDFENPMTIDEIKKAINLKAFDGYEGDITSKIQVAKDSYTINKNKVGTYEILFTVKNSSNRVKEYLLIVSVMDFKNPIIEGPSSKSLSYKDIITESDIESLFTVRDNYDTNLRVKIVDINVINGKVGKYFVLLEAVDSSKNKTNHQLEVNIIDDINPAFKDESQGIIKINYKDKITDEMLKLNLSASDEIDGNLTSSIKIIKNEIKNVLGFYNVTYEVIDLSGNKNTYVRKYEVISEDIPVFWISKNIITIEEINKMSIDQIAELISKYNNIEMLSYSVIKDEYSGFENVKGLYNVKLSINDKSGNTHTIEQKINVYESSIAHANHSRLGSNIVITLGTLLMTSFSTFLIIYKNKKKNI